MKFDSQNDNVNDGDVDQYISEEKKKEKKMI